MIDQLPIVFAVFEGVEDPSRSFFSEIISSISDVKFSNSGRYMISRDYLSVNVWDLKMETRPIETYQVWVELYFIVITIIKSEHSMWFWSSVNTAIGQRLNTMNTRKRRVARRGRRAKKLKSN